MKKWELYGNKGSNIKWFNSYLPNREQLIKFNNEKIYLEMIRCVVSLGSILSTFLILIIVNDLKSSTNLPDPMMFTDDTNLFYMNKNIEALSEIANNELQHVNDWFRTSRLSLHEGKRFFFISKDYVIAYHLEYLS